MKSFRLQYSLSDALYNFSYSERKRSPQFFQMFQPNANFCNQANCLNQPSAAATPTPSATAPAQFAPIQFSPSSGSWVPGQSNFWTWVPAAPANPPAPVVPAAGTAASVVTVQPAVVAAPAPVVPAAVILPPAAPAVTLVNKTDDDATKRYCVHCWSFLHSFLNIFCSHSFLK
jgi:hypothetical protein